MQRNSQELPSSPPNRDSTNSKRNFIRKEIDISKPKTLQLPSKSNQKSSHPPNKSQEICENSAEISSLDNEMQEFDVRETVRKIEERFNTQDSQHQKKLSAIKQFTNNISKNDPVILKTYGSNENLSDKTLEEFLSSGEKNEKKSTKMKENVEKQQDFEEKPQDFEDFEEEPQNFEDFEEKPEKLPLIVGRNKIQASWLSGKDSEEYEAFVYNALLLAESLGNQEKNPENSEKLRHWLRKNLKEAPDPRGNLLKFRKNFLFLERKEAFLQKIGKRFKLLQNRKAIIPAFLAFPSEKSEKLGFVQQSAKNKEKKYPFPSEVCVEIAKNEKKPWFFQKTPFLSRLKLELSDRKTPIFLYFPVEGDLKKARDFMVFKQLLGKKIDFLGFFKKRAFDYYSAQSGPFLEALKMQVSAQKRVKEEIPEERPGKRWEKSAKKPGKPVIFEEKGGFLQEKRVFEEKEDFLQEKRSLFEETLRGKEPENEVNVEPKTLVRMENQANSKEIARKLQQNALLSLQTRKNLGLFAAKWLETGLKQRSETAKARKTVSFAGFCVEIPQKLCFYKPNLEVVVLEGADTLLRKRLDLRVERKIGVFSKRSSVLKALEGSLDLNSYLSSNESVISWVCDGENSQLRVETLGNPEELRVEIALSDEGGFSLLSNFAEIHANAQQDAGKFVTHALKQHISLGNRRVFLGLRPIFSKESAENELLDQLVLSFVVFEGEIRDFPKEFQTFVDEFVEKHAELSKDLVYNLPINGGLKVKESPALGFFEEENVAQFLEDAQVLDFRRKFSMFSEFSQEKWLKNVDKFLAFREQELVCKGYLRNCDNLAKFLGKKRDFKELLENLQAEKPEEIAEIVANLSLKGLSNEFRSDLWTFLAKRRLLQRLKTGFRDFFARNPEFVHFSKRISEETAGFEGIFAVLREIVGKSREMLDLKAEFLRDFEAIGAKMLRTHENPQNYWEIIRMTRFAFRELLGKSFVYQENCLIILWNLAILLESRYNSSELSKQMPENSRVSLFFLYIFLLDGPVSRYFLENSEETAGFSRRFAGIQGDLVLFAEFLKERMPDFWRFFEQNRGNPLLFAEFADIFLNMFANSSTFTLRADILFRLWDVFATLEEIEEFSRGNAAIASKIPASELYKLYAISVFLTIFRRTARVFPQFRDFADFLRKVRISCRLLEDFEEFLAEVLEEIRELREFLKRKTQIFVDKERQMLKTSQFASQIHSVVAAQLRTNAGIPRKCLTFSAISRENALLGRENPLFSLEIARNSKLLHVFVHNLQAFQPISSESALILELSYEKSHTFHEISEETPADLYEKYVFQGNWRELRVNLHESAEKVPENVGVSFKKSLKLLSFASISLQNVKENVVFTGVFPLVSRETDANFARSLIKVSFLLENPENRDSLSYFRGVSSKNLRKCEEIMGFFEEGDEKFLKLRVSAETVQNSLNFLKKPQEDLELLNKQGITSSISSKIAYFPALSVESLQILLKSLEIKQDVAISSGFFAKIAQTHKLREISLEILENAPVFEHEVLISLILQSSGTFVEKTHAFFEYLAADSSDFTHVSLNKVKSFAASLYEMLGFLAFPNEIDNALETLLTNGRETLEKVRISLTIPGGVRKKYDLLNVFAMFLNKKHRFFGKKSLFFSDLRFFKEILWENRDNCEKIKDFFFFLEKNAFDEASSNQMWLKLTYFEGIVGRQTLKMRLSGDFSIISKGNPEPIASKSPFESQPLAHFLWLHGSSVLLENENFPVNRETFTYLLENLPLLKYFMRFGAEVSDEKPEKPEEMREKSAFSLEIVVENQRICTVTAEIATNFPENAEKITEDYYLLANRWRQKCLELQFSAQFREKPGVSSERGKIFEKELRMSPVSRFLPLKLAILGAQKTIISHFLEDFPAKFSVFPALCQLDFLRTHVYAHFPSKTQRIDIFSSEISSVMRENSTKSLILEYSLRNRAETGVFLTLDPSAGLRSSDIFTRNSEFFRQFPDFALFRSANHSAQWLKARVLRSIPAEKSKHSPESVRNKESFAGFEVVFELFPQEGFFKRPSEVVLLRDVDLARLQCCRLKTTNIFKSFVEKPMEKPGFSDGKSAVAQNSKNSKRNDEKSSVLPTQENEYVKVFETHEEDSEEMRNTPNSQYFNPEKKSLQGNSEELSAKKIKENKENEGKTDKSEENFEKFEEKKANVKEKQEKKVELKLNTFEKIPHESKENESFEGGNTEKDAKQKQILKKLYGEDEDLRERNEKNQGNSLIKLKKAYEPEQKPSEFQGKIPTNNDYEDSLELENQ